MSKYEKSAKDKAFNRERTKLQSQILKLKRDINGRDAHIEMLEATVKSQAQTVEQLHRELSKMMRVSKLSEEELKLLITQEKRNEELLKHVRLFRIVGGVGL